MKRKAQNEAGNMRQKKKRVSHSTQCQAEPSCAVLAQTQSDFVPSRKIESAIADARTLEFDKAALHLLLELTPTFFVNDAMANDTELTPYYVRLVAMVRSKYYRLLCT
jgi:protein-disulfide isomerase